MRGLDLNPGSVTSFVAQIVKKPSARQEDWVSSLGWEDPLEERMVTCSNSPMDRRAWQATVYGVAKSQTRLKQLTLPFSVTNWISGLGIVQFSVSSVSSSVK